MLGTQPLPFARTGITLNHWATTGFKLFIWIVVRLWLLWLISLFEWCVSSCWVVLCVIHLTQFFHHIREHQCATFCQCCQFLHYPVGMKRYLSITVLIFISWMTIYVEIFIHIHVSLLSCHSSLFIQTQLHIYDKIILLPVCCLSSSM